jgi:hypothetical protein
LAQLLTTSKYLEYFMLNCMHSNTYLLGYHDDRIPLSSDLSEQIKSLCHVKK